MTGPELETERLWMRQWRQEDFDVYATFFADELSRHVGGPLERPEAWRRFASVVGHWTLRGCGMWAVWEKGSEHLVGSVGLWFPEGWPELELGYWLVRASHGKGYATEAARKARAFAYDELGAATLVSYIHPENEPSKHVAGRLGAQYEETIELLDLGPTCVYRHSSSDREESRPPE